MFVETLPAEVFITQAEFIRVMEPSRDFVWWAENLIVEETAELNEALENEESMERVLSEMADVIYVVAGFYNCMPAGAKYTITAEHQQKIELILTQAYVLVSRASTDLNIPIKAVVMAFHEIHKANMSKLDDEGKPIRSDGTDGKPVGKILKGPNWKPADMAPIVAQMDTIREEAQSELDKILAKKQAEQEAQTPPTTS